MFHETDRTLRLARLVATTCCLALSLTAGGALAAEFREGKEYALLPQAQPADAKGKVEVIEFFWFGCPHCYEFEPTLKSWVKTLPADVAFRRVPADFGRWTGGTKLFYALEAIGEEERLHKELFDAIHGSERLNFNREAAVADWLSKKGVDRKKFADAYRSFSVQSNVSRAQQLTRAYALSGVPTVAIGGKYFTNNGMTNGFETMPAVMNQLIAKVRAEQGRPAAVATATAADKKPAGKGAK